MDGCCDFCKLKRQKLVRSKYFALEWNVPLKTTPNKGLMTYKFKFINPYDI